MSWRLCVKKSEVYHVLRAAGRIVGETQFIIIGSQSIHAKYPDRFSGAAISAEVDIIAKNKPDRTELLNVIGVDSPFHEMYGYYADPVDGTTALCVLIGGTVVLLGVGMLLFSRTQYHEVD